MALMSSRSWPEWIAAYESSHQHPRNRLFHTIGIPLIALSVIGFGVALAAPRVWPVAAALFVLGWVFQIAGHAYEGKPPEFLKDWRFLFVGLRWWFAKLGKPRGRA